MNHQEINYALALAIGWPLEKIVLYADAVYVDGRDFDYRNVDVIGPIAKHFHIESYCVETVAMSVIGVSWMTGDVA